ncbi:MAG: flippase [Desulfobacteraceae bacterium]
MQSKKTDVISKVAKGTSLILLGDTLKIFLNILTLGIVARYIPQDQFGYFSLSLILVNLFASLSCIGLENSLPGYIARENKNGRHDLVRGAIRSSGRITLSLSLFSMIFLFFFADLIGNIMEKPALSTPIRIMAPAIPLISFSLLFTSYLQSFENFKGRVINIIFFPLVRLFLITIVVWAHWSFYAIVSSNTIAFFTVFSILFIYTRSSLADLFSDKNITLVTSSLFWYSMPVLGTTIGRQMMMVTDSMVLGVFASAADVGVYNIGVRAARLSSLIGISINFVSLPIIARLYRQEKRQQLHHLYHRVHGIILLVLLPAFWIFSFFPEKIMQVFFGGDFNSPSSFLTILGTGWVVNILFGVNNSMLLAIGKNKIQLYCFFAATIVNVLGNFLLVPLYFKTGAALASCFSFFLSAILSLIMINKYLGLNPFKQVRYVLLITGGALMTCGLYYLYKNGYLFVQTNQDVVLHVLSFCLLSLILSWISGFLRKEQLMAIHNMAIHSNLLKKK